MREFECNAVAPGRMGIGDATRDLEVGIDRACPGDRDWALGSRMHEDRPCGQLRPDLQGICGGVHEDRGLGAEAPRFHLASLGVAVARFSQEHRGGCCLQKAPTGPVLVLPGVALQQIGNHIGDAPGALIAGRFADVPFDERAVGSVALVRQHGQEQQLAAPNRHLLLEGDRARFRHLRLHEHPFRRSPARLDFLLRRVESRLPPFPLSFHLGCFCLPLLRLCIGHRCRLDAESGPERCQVSCVEFLLCSDFRDGSGTVASEPVAMFQRRREMRRERRPSPFIRIAGVKTAQRFLRLSRPVRAIWRRRKPKARRQQHRARRDIACGLMIALDQPGRHRHRLTDIGKALAAHAVRSELTGPRRLHVHTREITHRMVIFRIGQPPQRHRPRVARVRCSHCIHRCPDPAQQLISLVQARLRSLLRRHVALIQSLGNVLQHLRLREQRLSGAKAREVEVVVLGLPAVAFPASLHHQRMNPLGIRLGPVSGPIGSGSRECEAQGQRRNDESNHRTHGWSGE